MLTEKLFGTAADLSVDQILSGRPLFIPAVPTTNDLANTTHFQVNTHPSGVQIGWCSFKMSNINFTGINMLIFMARVQSVFVERSQD